MFELWIGGMTPFDFIKSFETKAEYLFSDDTEKDYVPFVINRAMAFSVETIAYAEMMNRAAALDKKMQHDFYFYATPKKKRYSKWIKAEVENPDVLMIASLFSINKSQARKYLELLSAEQLDVIRKKTNKGGKA